MRVKAAVIVATVVTMLALATPANAQNRANKLDILFGLGSLASQEADIDQFSSLHAGDGTTFSVRLRYNFSPNIALEGDFTGESETTDLKDGGFTVDSVDTDTNFFFVNALFHFLESPISPYVSVGVGSFDHKGRVLVQDQFGNLFSQRITESGGAFDAAGGIDGRARNHLVWAFEARLLHYDFNDFADNWNRWQFSGHIGFHL